MDASDRYHVDTRRGACHRGGEPAAGLTDTVASRTNRDGGFALPIVIFALVLLGVIGVAALQASRDELLSATAVSGSNQAFYAAEAGIHSAVSNWDQDAMDTLVANPGDSLVGSWTTIENRCSYRLVYRRIDGGDAGTQLYSVESTGQSPGLNGGRRRMGIILKNRRGLSSAIAIGGFLTVAGDPQITGLCGDIHTNGDMNIQSNPIIAGTLTSSGTIMVGGTPGPLDTLGVPVTPLGDQPEVTLPELDPTDYCGDAEFIFNNTGQGIKVSTSEFFDFSNGDKHWNWGWSNDNTWYTDHASIPEGTYCVDGNLIVGHNIGSPGNPIDISFLATGSFQMNGDPYMTAAHPDDILIIAEGDVKLNGNPIGGNDSFEGLIYAGAQCVVDGDPILHAQLICADNPNPPGATAVSDVNVIQGNMQLTYMCGGLLANKESTPLAERMWSHVW